MTSPIQIHEQHERLQFRVETSWGPLVIDACGPHVTAVRAPVADGHEPVEVLHPQRVEVAADVAGAAPQVAALAGRMVRYFDGQLVDLVDDEQQLGRWLDAAGVTGFRRDVSLALARVPRGVTISYGELAELAGRPGAARAVGSACARNPLPIVVPCHRVLHAGARHGDVGTYGAGSGSGYKRRLLELEGAAHVR